MDGPQVSSGSMVHRVVHNIRHVVPFEHQIPGDHDLTIVVLVFTRDQYRCFETAVGTG